MRSAGSFVKDESGKLDKVEGTDNSGRLMATEAKDKKADEVNDETVAEEKTEGAPVKKKVSKKSKSKTTSGDK